MPSSSPWVAAESPESTAGILDGSEQPAGVADYFSADSAAGRGQPDRRSAAEPNHAAAEHDFFVPPSTQEDDRELDWDKTGFSTVPDDKSQTPDWDKTDFVAPLQSEDDASPDTDSGHYSEAQSLHPPDQQEASEPAPADAQPAGFQPAETPQRSGEVMREPAAAPKADSPKRSAVDMDALQAFLQGAGVQVGELSPEHASALMNLQGKLYREIVQGMMEVLRARFDLKNEFRMRQTQIQIKENNPLKFIGQVDDAIEHLVMRRSSGFLPPDAAFREAFQDIKDHQVAMVVGMRAAFESLLRRFDPEQLGRKFARTDKIGDILPLYRNASCWERYQEWYTEISAAAEDDFQGLFGNEFTRAYEDQMARLSLLRRKPEK